MKFNYYFVDCFGTLLLRSVPANYTYLLLSEELGNKYGVDKNILYRVILSAEKVARLKNANQSGECNIEEIASNCFRNLLLENVQLRDNKEIFISEFCDLYYGVEKSVCYVNSNLKSQLMKKKKAGAKIVLVSNYICGESFVKRLFREKGIDDLIDHYYISCDYHASKSDGKLYEVALYSLSIEKSSVVMIGNSKKTDVSAARKIGIKAFKVEKEDVKFDDSDLVGGVFQKQFFYQTS